MKSFALAMTVAVATASNYNSYDPTSRYSGRSSPSYGQQSYQQPSYQQHQHQPTQSGYDTNGFQQQAGFSAPSISDLPNSANFTGYVPAAPKSQSQVSAYGGYQQPKTQQYQSPSYGQQSQQRSYEPNQAPTQYGYQTAEPQHQHQQSSPYGQTS